MKPYELSELKTFKSKENGKVYPHYERHKANTRQVALDKFKKNRGVLTREEINKFKVGYNMGYKDAWKRDSETKSDSCLNCEIKLGFKGFCSKDCHKEYSRKPNKKVNIKQSQ